MTPHHLSKARLDRAYQRRADRLVQAELEQERAVIAQQAASDQIAERRKLAHLHDKLKRLRGFALTLTPDQLVIRKRSSTMGTAMWGIGLAVVGVVYLMLNRDVPDPLVVEFRPRLQHGAGVAPLGFAVAITFILVGAILMAFVFLVAVFIRSEDVRAVLAPGDPLVLALTRELTRHEAGYSPSLTRESILRELKASDSTVVKVSPSLLEKAVARFRSTEQRES